VIIYKDKSCRVEGVIQVDEFGGFGSYFTRHGTEVNGNAKPPPQRIIWLSADLPKEVFGKQLPLRGFWMPCKINPKVGTIIGCHKTFFWIERLIL
jgi:hypothetical protein